MSKRFTIPCPTKLRELHELLPRDSAIRLSCLDSDSHLGSSFIVYPRHQFTTDREKRSHFITNFWDEVKQHIDHKTTCVLRQHGKQTVLQLNL